MDIKVTVRDGATGKVDRKKSDRLNLNNEVEEAFQRGNKKLSDKGLQTMKKIRENPKSPLGSTDRTSVLARHANNAEIKRRKMKRKKAKK